MNYVYLFIKFHILTLKASQNSNPIKMLTNVVVNIFISTGEQLWQK